MTLHFGVLIPSTNTTVEMEYTRLLPASLQAHYGRLGKEGGSPFSPSKAADVAYQAKMLGDAKVGAVVLAQTSASLFADDYDEVTIRAMTEGAKAPAMTSAVAVGRAARALGCLRVAIVSPYSEEASARAKRYFEMKHGLDVVAVEGFGATDAYAIGALGPENARAAFKRIDRPGIDAFLVPGGNFPTMAHAPGWEKEFGKPMITTNGAALWAVLGMMGAREKLPHEKLVGLGRLLETMPGLTDPA